MDDQTIEKGLQKHFYVPNRMEIYNSNGNTVLFDCYNANPFSMKTAIEFWSQTDSEKTHYAILGDMLELGEFSDKYHLEIGEEITKVRENLKGTDVKVISVGGFAKLYNPDKCFANVDELLNICKRNVVRPYNSVILVKGSHGIKLEKLRGVV
jgi:UDP-N-acetylmuramyl pentapeptide synthase